MIFLYLMACGGIAWLWSNGIEDIKTNHPDYKGEDFLDEDKNDMI
jgi:hypothetical protein